MKKSFINTLKSMSFCDFSKMFSLKRCGSGSEVEVNGWIKDFYFQTPRVNYLENFIPCIAKVDYKCYNDDNNYRMFAGLFTSEIEDGYLIPAFDFMYFKKNNIE